MFNILLVDDQQTKYEEIKRIINLDKVNFYWLENHSRIKSMLYRDYDLILLDMSYPGDSLGGLGVLNRLVLEKYHCPVIVITQYYNFINLESADESICIINNNYGKEVDEVIEYEDNLKMLPDLHNYLTNVYPNYYGCVLFSSFNTSWVDNLKIFLKEILPNEDIIVG